MRGMREGLLRLQRLLTEGMQHLDPDLQAVCAGHSGWALGSAYELPWADPAAADAPAPATSTGHEQALGRLTRRLEKQLQLRERAVEERALVQREQADAIELYTVREAALKNELAVCTASYQAFGEAG